MTGPVPRSPAPTPEPTPPPGGPRRIRRSRTDRMIGGVCGGIAASLGIDAVLLRIAAVALALSGGVGVLAYVAAWILIPEAGSGDGADDPVPQAPPPSRHSVAIAVGSCLVGMGALLLLRAWVPGLGTHLFWPLVVVAAGILVLVSARR
ncbi:PspC domain-containing protein [Pseudonocardia lacus]|uniref:PspC domain-containing protein n=1 Tax=Pseudonocardia lacus TaxID=2835865 RepID=UPI001BDD13D4|nr:PspC domain-containing protein [Pseudonocardia lacus]